MFKKFVINWAREDCQKHLNSKWGKEANLLLAKSFVKRDEKEVVGMACEGPPPPKKQALDTGQGLEQRLDGFQEESVWDSVTAIQDKLEICLSHNCLCSVSDDEVSAFIQEFNSTFLFKTKVKMYISLCQTQLPRRTGGPTLEPNSPGGNFDFGFEKVAIIDLRSRLLPPLPWLPLLGGNHLPWPARQRFCLPGSPRCC